MLNAFLLMGGLIGVDPALLAGLCYVESGHNDKAYVQYDGNSPSYGICQLKLSTARLEGFSGSPKELMNHETNIFYAAKYLKRQIKKYGSIERGVSAYNAGRPIVSNEPYVKKVIKQYLKHRKVMYASGL